MKGWLLPRVRSGLRAHYFPIVGFALIAAPLLLAWLGSRATHEWQLSTRMLVEKRTSDVATLMIMALNQDMRGAQVQVLPELESLAVRGTSLTDEVTRAFARFPYPESFFSWTADKGNPGDLIVFNRTERPPLWRETSVGTIIFPTTILKNPAEFAPIVSLLRERATMPAQVALLEIQVGVETYQVIARPRYGGESETTLQGMVGFTVNTGWARAHYFPELTAQLAHLLAGQSNVALSIIDDKGAIAATNRPVGLRQPSLQLPVRDRRFPLLFFDPILSAGGPEGDIPVRYWTARAEASEDDSMSTAESGARRTFILIWLTAAAAGIALLLAVRAARAAAVLATMKSEFVSAVTHELKTPLSSIRLVCETLIRGRYRSQEAIAEYANVLLSEALRLTRTVDNLLSITRVQDAGGFYMFESVDLIEVVEEVLGRFQVQLKERGFELRVDIPASLPRVHADRAAILLVLDNLLDNAIRYSKGGRRLRLSASTSGDRVSLRIADNGPGIPTDELPLVFDKFYRGRDAASTGSGLGLAIAQRVLQDHGGDLRLHSVDGRGTTAEVFLCPANAEASYETANSGR
ncbi:MAG: HAMP domain-containing sensor histidine kinase [Bryobacteraceae bacterium]|jgi:signal transduction histidine kinase